MAERASIALCVSLQVAGAAFCPTAHAQVEPSRAADPSREVERTIRAALEWDSPVNSGCIDGPRLMAATEERLRRRAFYETEPDFVIRGIVRPREEGGWVAELSLFDADGAEIGVRRLESDGESCAALEEGLPVTLALMIDLRAQVVLELLQAPPPSPPAPMPRPPSPTSPPAVAEWLFGLSLHGTAAAWMLPELPFGAGLSLLLEMPGPFQARATTTFWFPREHHAEQGGSSIWALEGGLSLCLEFLHASPLRFHGCAGAHLGRFAAKGIDVDIVRKDSDVLASGRVSAQLEAALTPSVALGLGLTGGFPFVRHTFAVETPLGREPFFEANAAFAQLELALVFWMPP